MSDILKSVLEDLGALREAGIEIDPEDIFRRVDRERESGELYEYLCKTNRYLTFLDKDGKVVRKKCR